MTGELEQYEEAIKVKHHIGFGPKHKEEFRTHLNEAVFVPIVLKTVEKLGWDIVYCDEVSVEVKRKNDSDKWTEKITISYDHRNVTVQSVSLGSEIWDTGRNSQRVRLFIYVFKQLEQEYDTEALAELEEETNRKNNWDDYEIPESLPQPTIYKKPNFYIPLIGGIVTALLLGYAIAFLSVEAIYIFGIYEFVVAIIIVSALNYLIKFGNYTDFGKLKFLLIGMIILTYTSCQYFEYHIIIDKQSWISIGFLDFMKLRIEQGLTIESIDTGTIGLIISWIFQLGLTYIIALLRLINRLTVYQLERIPPEVADFAFYHLVKGKTEEQIRTELACMGWGDEQLQDEVFESIGAIQSVKEINRMD